MKALWMSPACAVGLMFGLMTISEAALVGRLPATPGQFDFQAIYDTDRDITWLQNANLAAGNSFGLPYGTNLGPHPSDSSGENGLINANGSMNWPGALHWIDAMNTANHLGFNDWRFPTTLVPDLSCAPGTSQPQTSGCQGSEFGHLYYIELLNPLGGPFPNTGAFSEVQFTRYWSGTEFDSFFQWVFNFIGEGVQEPDDKSVSFGHYAWAVRDGDVAAVPTPSAMLLMGTGLIGLVGWRWWNTQ